MPGLARGAGGKTASESGPIPKMAEIIGAGSAKKAGAWCDTLWNTEK